MQSMFVSMLVVFECCLTLVSLLWLVWLIKLSCVVHQMEAARWKCWHTRAVVTWAIRCRQCRLHSEVQSTSKYRRKHEGCLDIHSQPAGGGLPAICRVPWVGLSRSCCWQSWSHGRTSASSARRAFDRKQWRWYSRNVMSSTGLHVSWM